MEYLSHKASQEGNCSYFTPAHCGTKHLVSKPAPSANATANRRSFDYASRDGAARGFAQDDSFWVNERKSKGKSNGKSEMRGSLHCGSKSAASGRDDGGWGGCWL